MSEMKRCHLLFSFLLIEVLLLSSAYQVFGTDELFMTGIVKSIDRKTGIVTVDVKSETCRGIRHFKSEDASVVDDIRPGKKILFRTDSPSCTGSGVYKMILPGRAGR
jgi:hypothetical protein